MAAGQGAEWCLIERAGQRHPLPIQSMTFLGREDCDVTIKSVSVDKRHAVLTFDPGKKKFKMKDLGSVNGTFVNDRRISEEEYIFLDRQDKLRFGFDPMEFTMESSEVSSTPKDAVKDVAPPPQDIPAWAKRTEASKSMAECPGCIAEQDIQHICGSCQSDEVSVSSNSSFTVVSQELVPNGHLATGLPASEQDIKVSAGHAPQWKGGPTICQEAVFTVKPPQEHQDHVNLLFAHRPKLVHSREPDPAEVNTLPATYGVSNHSDDVLMRLGSTPAYAPCPHQVLQHSHCTCSHAHARAGYISAQPCFDAVTYIAPNSTVLHRHYVTGMTNVEYSERSELLRTNEVLQTASGSFALPVSCEVNKESHSTSTTSSERRSSDVGKAGRDIGRITAPVLSPTARTFEVKAYDTIKLSQFTTPAANVPCIVAADPVNPSLDNASQAVKQVISVNKVSDKGDIPSPTEAGSIREPPERDTPNQHRPPPGSPDAATSPDSPALARRDKRRSLTGRETDLKTVKKGTPLYGQPSWWGEEEDDTEKDSYTNTPSLTDSKLLKDHENTVTQDKSLADRPNCLGLDKSVNGMDAKHANEDRYGVNYMEIPYQDSRGQTIGDKRGSQTPPEKDTPAKSPEDVAPGMAFTVDFSDTPNKLTMTDSISRFLPANVRRSFRDRKPKKLDQREDSLDEDSLDKEKKQNGQMSPTRQKKIDTLFGIESPVSRRRKKKKVPTATLR